MNRNIPSSGHIVGERWPRADLSGESQVGDLDDLGTHAHYVFGLEVPVEEPVLVHKRQSSEHLKGDVANDWLRKVALSGRYRLRVQTKAWHGIYSSS